MKMQKPKLASTHLSSQISCDGPNVTIYNQNLPCKQQQSINLTKSIRKIHLIDQTWTQNSPNNKSHTCIGSFIVTLFVPII